MPTNIEENHMLGVLFVLCVQCINLLDYFCSNSRFDNKQKIIKKNTYLINYKTIVIYVELINFLFAKFVLIVLI